MLSFIFFMLLLAVNFGISWANAHTCGMYWSESKSTGGFFRLNIIAGYIMSIAGFTMVYGYLLFIVVSVILPLFPQFSDVKIISFVQLGSDLLYVLLALTIIPSGFIIWIRSLKNFWEQKCISNAMVAGWNTFAQIHNTVTAAREVPNAFARISKALFGGKGRKKADTYVVLTAIFVIILAVCGGYFTASSIMRKADKEYDAFKIMRRHASRA